MKYVLACFLIVVSALSASSTRAQSSPSVKIAAPRDGAIVALGEVKVQIETQNFTLDGVHHWRLYVDGKLREMVQGGMNEYTTRLDTSGPHQIMVTLADAEHDELASAMVEVTAAPATPRHSPFNVPQVAAVMGVLLLVVSGLIAVGLRIVPRPS